MNSWHSERVSRWRRACFRRKAQGQGGPAQIHWFPDLGGFCRYRWNLCGMFGLSSFSHQIWVELSRNCTKKCVSSCFVVIYPKIPFRDLYGCHMVLKNVNGARIVQIWRKDPQIETFCIPELAKSMHFGSRPRSGTQLFRNQCRSNWIAFRNNPKENDSL